MDSVPSGHSALAAGAASTTGYLNFQDLVALANFQRCYYNRSGK